MKNWKKAFWLSLIVNIVLAYWSFKQRKLILETNRQSQKDSDAIAYATQEMEKMYGNLSNLRQNMHEQHLRTIASNDQLDAFLEERGYYVE